MWLSCVLWLLGHPDQALERSQQALELARDLDHPLNLAFAQTNLAVIHILRREIEAALAPAEACIQLSTEYGLSHILAVAAFCRGWALVRRGQVEAGLAQIRQGMGSSEVGGEALLPPQLAMLAETYALAGQPAAGLPVLDRAEAVAERSGVRWYDAEIHRLRGDLLQAKRSATPVVQAKRSAAPVVQAKRSAAPVVNKGGADPDEVAAHYHQAIQVARRQEARSWELRAVMSLCRLRRSQGAQGKIQEARHMLAEIYGWFSEGFDTGDLQEARGLLDALA
jgi:adenylate cyclase